MFFNLDLLVTQIKKVKNFRRSPFLAPRPCTATFLRLPSDSDPCSGLVSLRLFPKLTNRHSLLCLVAAFSHHQPVHFWSLTFKTSSTITTNPYTRHLGVHSVPKSFVHHLSAIPKSLFCLKTFVKRFGLLMGSRPKCIQVSSPKHTFALLHSRIKGMASRSHHLNNCLKSSRSQHPVPNCLRIRNFQVRANW